LVVLCQSGKTALLIIFSETALLPVFCLWNYFKYLGEQLFMVDRFGDKAGKETLRIELVVLRLEVTMLIANLSLLSENN
jgi:hypothetical protein